MVRFWERELDALAGPQQSQRAIVVAVDLVLDLGPDNTFWPDAVEVLSNHADEIGAASTGDVEVEARARSSSISSSIG